MHVQPFSIKIKLFQLLGKVLFFIKLARFIFWHDAAIEIQILLDCRECVDVVLMVTVTGYNLLCCWLQ